MKSFAHAISALLLLVATSCTNSNTPSNGAGKAPDSSSSGLSSAIKPKGPNPSFAPDMRPEMAAVIEKLSSYGDKPIETLTPAQARKNHTPTDAVMDLMKENHISTPVSTVDTTGKDIPVAGGKIHLRIYTPKNGTSPFPAIVYYHGGGFVIANLDVYDASARGMAMQTGAVVISVAYRLAPEYKFPTAHKDAFSAYEWVVKNATALHADPKKIAVMGESAGGNLAANVSIMALKSKTALPVCQILVYPVAGSNMSTPSYLKNAAAKPLNKPMMMWFVKNYLNSMDEAIDPRINLVGANLKGLEPTTIITAEIDPLQSEGKTLAGELKGAGVQVDSKNYDGVTHEFFGMATVVPEAKAAQAYAVDQLKKAFAK